MNSGVSMKKRRLVMRTDNPAAGIIRKIGDEHGKIGWILLWALGVPIPVLLVLFLIRGRT
jgi:hypothetical protein